MGWVIETNYKRCYAHKITSFGYKITYTVKGLEFFGVYDGKRITPRLKH